MMKAKNDVAVYVIRGADDIQTRSKELTAMCFNRHFGFVPEIKREANGKPYFADTSLGTFSVSHSAHIYVLAVCGGKDIGIDVEIPKEGKDYSRLEKKYLGECERESDFFRVWTAKEACCKLTGDGLAAMGKVKVSFQPFCADMQGSDRLYLYDLSSAVGAPCTLAANEEVTWKVNDL